LFCASSLGAVGGSKLADFKTEGGLSIGAQEAEIALAVSALAALVVMQLQLLDAECWRAATFRTLPGIEVSLVSERLQALGGRSWPNLPTAKETWLDLRTLGYS
jgi:hypothetical protein